MPTPPRSQGISPSMSGFFGSGLPGSTRQPQSRSSAKSSGIRSGIRRSPVVTSHCLARGLLSLREPVGGDLERPDLAAERLGVPAGDPDLVLEDVGGVLVAFLPDDVFDCQLLPGLAVAGVPDVAPVLRGVVRPAAQDPDPVAVDDRGEPDPRVPGRVRRSPAPSSRPSAEHQTSFRAWYFGHVVAAAEDPDLAVVDDRGVVGPRATRGRAAVSCLQSLPSADDQTSFLRLLSSPK